jgi:hypothetical protein
MMPKKETNVFLALSIANKNQSDRHTLIVFFVTVTTD